MDVHHGQRPADAAAPDTAPDGASLEPITLKAARLAADMTQEELSLASGEAGLGPAVNQALISRLERGLVDDPASSTVMRLAAALKCDPRRLRFVK